MRARAPLPTEVRLGWIFRYAYL